MRNILALIGAVVVGFAGLGWYLGWYQISREPSADGHTTFKVDIDKKKFSDSEKKLENAIHQQTGGNSNQQPGGTPNTPPPKQVGGQTTGFQFNPDGSATIVFPKREGNPNP